ncbi:DAK2 domain-containing protein [Laedolimicola ammoniilytica]|uniref:DAK2 domain-containing protein n=1 Tax=Laedolimicola ammoniilytica TaxID=2981771 RepID=A0ABT2RUH7_9FIRM|nr:DAK2 domain-containing protein [Laedolimicola ammoniilytica]MCU6695972.1 DAK2 domain-containing protein [Laedolimicola ammoniilytica]SCH34040.1 dihydroxyacetone kinase [uncultured Clostridium sp.]
MKTIEVNTLTKMFLAGAKNLEAKKEWINELNVFPVPDGDTGTNMTLTIMSAASEVNNLSERTMETVAKAISSGSLRGARGNSGVILSQLLRGFTKGIKGYETLDVMIISNAFQKAVETAYKAVMKPKEGTILTVARGAADKAAELALEEEDLDVFFSGIIEEAERVLATTPDLLPVLKEAGVVDSGGQGLVEVLKGAYDAYLGKEVDYTFEAPKSAPVKISAETEAEIKFGYCTEFIIVLDKKFEHKDEMEFKAFLESIGDSIVCVADDDIVKIHVHTNHPGQAIEKALTYGSLSRLKIDNMREEHEEKLIKDASKIAAQQKAEEPRKEMGFISVSIGEGIGEIFKGLGVDYLIEGGQTMNPSTEDMLNAIDKVNAEHIFILPNNKNIILAANQAKALCEDKDIIVIPTKTVPQGITAMINFMPDSSAEENEARMTEELANVKTGQVTYAVRDTHIDDKEIKEGNIMGIGDHAILAVGEDVEQTTLDMFKELIDEDSELISIYYGEDVKKEDAEKLGEKLSDLYHDCDVEVHFGGQPIYYYVVSVE